MEACSPKTGGVITIGFDIENDGIIVAGFIGTLPLGAVRTAFWVEHGTKHIKKRHANSLSTGTERLYAASLMFTQFTNTNPPVLFLCDRIRHHRHVIDNDTMRRVHVHFARCAAALCAIALPLSFAGCSSSASLNAGSNQSEQSNSQQSDASHDALDKSNVPSVVDDSPHGRAVAAVNAMSLAERVGQLVMAPLYAGSDPSSLQDLIVNQHVGSVLIIGNWNSGTAGVAAATSALQSYAPANNQLLMTTDQEGGLVQHLQGDGFDQMPSATNQGSMSTNQLRQSAAVWGSQLKSAGINVDLAPVVGTVTVDRASNGPIGALYRDFGLDADGNADHANIKIGKAGRNRWRGIRPTVRGTVMNPVDHPHGGGEGKNHTSGRPSVTPWGKPTKGLRTRKKKKVSNQHIIRRRKK